MKKMFVNFKRFDIPRSFGGICPHDDSVVWINEVISESAKLGLGKDNRVHIVYFLPENLLIPAKQAIEKIGTHEFSSISLGCQGVYRLDVHKDGNFGAFTTFLPASAAISMGCSWAMVGHSEERKDLFEIVSMYDPSITTDTKAMKKANLVINNIINQEALRACEVGLNVLICMGETQEERGNGTFDEQEKRLKSVLRMQVELGLKDLNKFVEKQEVTIGYEPRWAIGPGKTPPGAEYIEHASSILIDAAKELYNLHVEVVYGGGVKVENAKYIASVHSISGGLVALTKFTPPVGFSVSEFKAIIDQYC